MAQNEETFVVPNKDRGGNSIEIGDAQGYIGHLPDELPSPVIDKPNPQPVHPSDTVELARRGQAPEPAAEIEPEPAPEPSE